jgi:hypothetical protein
VAIVNATEAGDEVLHAAHCQALRAYYDEQTRLGRTHPFLTEAMADYTENAAEAARLYELALKQSLAFPDEPTHTKMICLAEQMIELGRTEQAEAYLRDGRGEAVCRGDRDSIKDADGLLQKLATG